MKKMKMLVWALVALVGLSTLTGCSTVVKGTKRTLTVDSNVPGTQVRLASRGRDQVKTVPAVFRLGTHKDRGEIKLIGQAPDGRCIQQVLTWESSDGKIYMTGGAVGWGVVTGVGGLVSLFADLGTKSYKDLSQDSIFFRFDPSTAQPTPNVAARGLGRSFTRPPKPAPSPSVATVPCPPLEGQEVLVPAPPQGPVPDNGPKPVRKFIWGAAGAK